MRADAEGNRHRLFEVAARSIQRDGAGASMKAIAREAGVGIGTVYRHFPTREALVEAVYRQEVARLCAAAGTLARAHPGIDALREWMELFVDFMATKRGMGDALRTVLTSEEDRQDTRDQLRDSLALLLAQARNEARPGADPYELLMALGGITLIAAAENQRALASSLINLVLNGVAVNGVAVHDRPVR